MGGAKVFPDRASPELSRTDLCLEKTPTELHNGTSFTASWAQGTLRRLSPAQGLALSSWTDSRCEGTGSSEASPGSSMHTALAAVMFYGEWGIPLHVTKSCQFGILKRPSRQPETQQEDGILFRKGV